MRVFSRLSALAIGPLLGVAADSLGLQLGERSVEAITDWLSRRFVDHSAKLIVALRRANELAWRALEMALGGQTLWQRLGQALGRSESKALAGQMRKFIDAAPLRVPGEDGPRFCSLCLGELRIARAAGLLSAALPDMTALAREAGALAQFADPAAMLDAEWRLISAIASEFPQDKYEHLRRLLGLRAATDGDGDAASVLTAAVRYFLRREVEKDQDLFQGLAFGQLQQISAAQAKGFRALDEVLDQHGQLLEQLLSRVEQTHAMVALTHETVVQTQSLAIDTHGKVLDLQALLQQLVQMSSSRDAALIDLLKETNDRLLRLDMQHGQVRLRHSLSIHTDDEKAAVRALLSRYRELPESQRQRVPALLNGLGKLQLGAGDFPAAQQSFEEVARALAEPHAQAEAHYNAYCAALEQRKWDVALAQLLEACNLDAEQFAPLPLRKYVPKKILGAGGFGVVFLCDRWHLNRQAVIKSLHGEELDRAVTDIFNEAMTLHDLDHPNIIRVIDCDYADEAFGKPFMVMDYFPGQSLQSYLHEHHQLPLADFVKVALCIAEALHAAHRQGVLHRDIKPDNVLVRVEENGRWQVKVIDFGMALRQQTMRQSIIAPNLAQTVLGSSVAGTMDYAPPEQMGRLPGVQPGPYSDIYSFGRLCCMALFGETELRRRHLAAVPPALGDLLDQCLEHQPACRPQNFEQIIAVLQSLSAGGPPPPNHDAKTTLANNATESLKARPVPRKQPADPRPPVAPKSPPAPEAPASPPDAPPRPAEVPVLPPSTAPLTSGQPLSAGPVNSVGMKLIRIPAGEFMMGSPPSEPNRHPEESTHRVSFTRPFLMSAHMVTRACFRAFVNATGYVTAAENDGYSHVWTGSEWEHADRQTWRSPGFEQDDHHPVVCVNWHDAQAFCEWLTKTERCRYRLPSESQWEYACRAGTRSVYPWGDDPNAGKGWCNAADLTAKTKFPTWTTFNWSDGYVYTSPVGAFRPNAWGLYDMIGNAWEWCADWYGEYPANDAVDPAGPPAGSLRVLRGGSCISTPQSCRCAYRYWFNPTYRTNSIGFRCVADIV